jgi:hypothetical protein
VTYLVEGRSVRIIDDRGVIDDARVSDMFSFNIVVILKQNATVHDLLPWRRSRSVYIIDEWAAVIVDAGVFDMIVQCHGAMILKV